jgi:hypothetical protein
MLKLHGLGRAGQLGDGVKLGLPFVKDWDYRKLVQSRDSISRDVGRLVGLIQVDGGYQQAKSGGAGIDGQLDSHRDKFANFGGDGAYLVADEVQGVVRVMVREMGSSVDAGGGISDVEMVALELV